MLTVLKPQFTYYKNLCATNKFLYSVKNMYKSKKNNLCPHYLNNLSNASKRFSVWITFKSRQ